jgi:hypothetical protein
MHDADASMYIFYCSIFIPYSFQAPNFVPREYLKTWQERHHLWLELSDVSKDVTHQIRVTVIPFYM